MLGVGIDWAETFHVIALGRPGEGVVQVLWVEHSKPALEGLLEQLRALEPAPDQVRVVLETRHGLLVERLLEAGFVVVPVNPDLIARRRGPAKKEGRRRGRPHRLLVGPGPLPAAATPYPPRRARC